MQKNIIGLKIKKIKLKKIEKKKGKKKKNSIELQKPNIEAEVYNNSKKYA